MQTSLRGATKYIVYAKSDVNGLMHSRVFTLGTDTTMLQNIGYLVRCDPFGDPFDPTFLGIFQLEVRHRCSVSL